MQPARKNPDDDYGVAKHTYVVLIRKEPHTDYWADIPDLPGCASSGATAAEAMANFEEALRLHLKGLMEDGAKLPAPRGIEAVIASDPGSFTEIYLVDIIDPQLLLRLRFSKLAQPAG
jgi:predicted RNase H-like HicB family nuclease